MDFNVVGLLMAQSEHRATEFLCPLFRSKADIGKNVRASHAIRKQNPIERLDV